MKAKLLEVEETRCVVMTKELSVRVSCRDVVWWSLTRCRLSSRWYRTATLAPGSLYAPPGALVEPSSCLRTLAML